MDEKELITLLGDDAWTICDLLRRTVKALRSHGFPKGDPKAQMELAVRHLMGRDKINWTLGEKLLEKLDARTALAIVRVGNSKKELVKAWLL